jgi:hypothetical protein
MWTLFVKQSSIKQASKQALVEGPSPQLRIYQIFLTDPMGDKRSPLSIP